MLFADRLPVSIREITVNEELPEKRPRLGTLMRKRLLEGHFTQVFRLGPLEWYSVDDDFAMEMIDRGERKLDEHPSFSIVKSTGKIVNKFSRKAQYNEVMWKRNSFPTLEELFNWFESIRQSNRK